MGVLGQMPAEGPRPRLPMEQAEDITPTQTPAPRAEPTYEPSIDDNVSRVDTEDANEAQHEFSRFDQGPLAEQPAFIPDDSDTDDAVPPPIARHAKDSETAQSSTTNRDPSTDDLSKVDPSDRWAQIRKNAQDRAAKRQVPGPGAGGKKKSTDVDDDTSGEESESTKLPVGAARKN